jgi:shikimate kinase
MKKILLSQPVFLCGMMGSGKSTIGRDLARYLNVSFCDLDSIIEKELGKTIPEIFALNGEEFFRKTERELLIKKSQTVQGVMALGGGSLQNQFLVDHVKLNGWLVFLDTPHSVLLNRLKNSENRPMLSSDKATESPDQLIKKLLDARKPFYSQAHITIRTGNLTRQKIVDQILQKLSIYEQQKY